MKYLIAVALGLIIFTVAYNYGKWVGESPNIIYQVASSDDNLSLWERDPSLAKNGIFSATVVTNTDDQLVVYVDYIYSGSHGETATTCGSVLDQGNGWVWSCFPTGIKKGRGFVTLKFKLIDRAKDIECSNEIKINFYDKNGATFFQKIIPYNKIWLKHGLGHIDKLKSRITECPKASNNNDIDTSTGLKSTNQVSSSDKMQRLISTNERIRGNAYEELLSELSKQDPGYYLKNGDALLSILSIAVMNQDSEISQSAAASIYQLSAAALVTRQGNGRFLHYPDVGKSKELRSALFKAVSNGPNKETKKLSAASLSMGFKFKPSIEKFLMAEFQRTEHSVNEREAILSALGLALKISGNDRSFYYDTTLPIIINAISERNEIGNAAVGIIIQTKSKEALPYLIEKLRVVSKLSDYRGILVALEKQKHNAKEYIPALNDILIATRDAEYRNALASTIKRLKGS